MSSRPSPGRPEADANLQGLTATLVALEALLVGAGTVALVLQTVRDPGAGPLTPVIMLMTLGAASSVGLLACARAVRWGASWTRGPVITWQLLQVGVAMPLVFSNAWRLGVPLFLVGLAVLGLVISGRVVPRPGS